MDSNVLRRRRIGSPTEGETVILQNRTAMPTLARRWRRYCSTGESNTTGRVWTSRKRFEDALMSGLACGCTPISCRPGGGVLDRANLLTTRSDYWQTPPPFATVMLGSMSRV